MNTFDLNNKMYSLCYLQLQAFQPFFIYLNLPYSVIRGEEFALEVILFNYLQDAIEVIFSGSCLSFLLHGKMKSHVGFGLDIWTSGFSASSMH